MRKRTWLTLGLITSAGLPLVGCQPRVPIELSLAAGGFGTFLVEAGVPEKNKGPYSLTGRQVDVGNGSFTIYLADIAVTPDGIGEGTVNPLGGTLVVTAWIGPVGEVETVCETGDQYGPFSVELDESYDPVSKHPSSIPLSEETLDLINGGNFSLCLEVVSPIDGTITIDALNISLGL